MPPTAAGAKSQFVKKSAEPSAAGAGHKNFEFHDPVILWSGYKGYKGPGYKGPADYGNKLPGTPGYKSTPGSGYKDSGPGGFKDFGGPGYKKTPGAGFKGPGY
jgi:hypothetical protein